jgi:hypothetical protein
MFPPTPRQAVGNYHVNQSAIYNGVNELLKRERNELLPADAMKRLNEGRRYSRLRIVRWVANRENGAQRKPQDPTAHIRILDPNDHPGVENEGLIDNSKEVSTNSARKIAQMGIYRAARNKDSWRPVNPESEPIINVRLISDNEAALIQRHAAEAATIESRKFFDGELQAPEFYPESNDTDRPIIPKNY